MSLDVSCTQWGDCGETLLKLLKGRIRGRLGIGRDCLPEQQLPKQLVFAISIVLEKLFGKTQPRRLSGPMLTEPRDRVPGGRPHVVSNSLVDIFADLIIDCGVPVPGFRLKPAVNAHRPRHRFISYQCLLARQVLLCNRQVDNLHQRLQCVANVALSLESQGGFGVQTDSLFQRSVRQFQLIDQPRSIGLVEGHTIAHRPRQQLLGSILLVGLDCLTQRHQRFGDTTTIE